MAKTKLVEGLIRDGAELLCELDRQNFPVESMFWIHLPDAGYWRLVVASPIVSQQGLAAGYRRLNELLREVELAGVTLEDISLLDPESPDFQSLYSLARGSNRLVAGPKWLELDEATVYRWMGAPIRGELTCELSSKELSQFWEAERNLSGRLSHPALLTSSEKGVVTLRFHPQHGPREHGSRREIDEVERAFQIALHRKDARPDCQVRWLN